MSKTEDLSFVMGQEKPIKTETNMSEENTQSPVLALMSEYPDKTVEEAVDYLVDRWHTSDSELELNEYLGWTDAEYSKWVETSELPSYLLNEESKVAHVFGHSDDLILVKGDFSTETSYDEPSHVLFSDGTVLKVNYDDEGNWRINCVEEGSAKLTKVCAGQADCNDYSDKVTLVGDLKWCCVGVFNKSK